MVHVLLGREWPEGNPHQRLRGLRVTTVVPHLRVGQVELVRRDGEAAVRLDQDGRGGSIRALFNPTLGHRVDGVKPRARSVTEPPT